MMEGVMIFSAMIMVEIMDVITTTLSKAAMSKGMNNLVFVVYSNALATFLLLPFLLLSRFRNKETSPLSLSMILGFFLLGLNGSVGQILAYTGLKYSSPSLLSAFSNLIPIFTFLLALLFRMEKIDLRRRSGKAKCVGTILVVFGASLITLYKGPLLINISSSKSFVKQHDEEDDHHLLLSHHSNWIFGVFLFLIVCFLSASWHIAQTWFVEKYPNKKATNVFFFTLSVTVQTAVFTIVVETNPIVWQLRTNIEMVAILFTAIFIRVVRIGVHTWCLQRKGPLYVAMFNPIGMVVAIPLVVTFLHEPLYLGSVMGSIIIGCGFYSVIWGQIKQLHYLALPSSTPHPQYESPCASLLPPPSFLNVD